MGKLPKISIITPSFNQGEFIEETILSVLNQNYPNLEYIIIDGGSTDNTRNIIKKYENKFSYWISEPDSGQSNAINKGLRIASGEIICWLNSDDLYLPGSLFEIGNYFKEHPDTNFLFGKCIAFNNKKDIITWWENYPDNILNYLSGTPFPPQPSSFFSKRVINEVGLIDESLHFSMDFDFLVRIALLFPITKTDLLLSKFRHHDNSKTIQQTEKFNQNRMLIYNKLFNTFKDVKDMTEDLTKFGLYVPVNDTYTKKIDLSKEQIDELFVYLLANQAHFNYGINNYSKSKELAKIVKERNKKIYSELGLRKLVLKMNLLTPEIAGFLRKIKRS